MSSHELSELNDSDIGDEGVFGLDEKVRSLQLDAHGSKMVLATRQTLNKDLKALLEEKNKHHQMFVVQNEEELIEMIDGLVCNLLGLQIHRSQLLSCEIGC